MDLEAKVRDILVTNIGLEIELEKIRPEVTLESLGFDSLDRVEFAMKLEDEFKVEIEDGHCEAWKTFGDVVLYLKERGLS